MAELQDNVPPGWDCRIDLKTGRQYYINHYTKSTTWEDPRLRLRHHGTPLHVATNQMEMIQMQVI
ncbi:PREDICTED: transcriptional coactivator yorkie-like [Nicrophorus vespilloides]|uniref:Transcriptional coactivator yorkie-like n=1 Tax=Nicrophorus vespilloides TaxID=110193 RepID=A0ABM1MGF3_NICVS|nr:PREDICTED: transcriptional coactivator yorkie-like [Nicrophorus vespilloides]